MPVTREQLQQALTELDVQVAGPSVNPTLYNKDELATVLSQKLNEVVKREQPFGSQDTDVARAARRGFHGG